MSSARPGVGTGAVVPPHERHGHRSAGSRQKAIADLVRPVLVRPTAETLRRAARRADQLARRGDVDRNTAAVALALAAQRAGMGQNAALDEIRAGFREGVPR